MEIEHVLFSCNMLHGISFTFIVVTDYIGSHFRLILLKLISYADTLKKFNNTSTNWEINTSTLTSSNYNTIVF